MCEFNRVNGKGREGGRTRPYKQCYIKRSEAKVLILKDLGSF